MEGDATGIADDELIRTSICPFEEGETVIYGGVEAEYAEFPHMVNRSPRSPFHTISDLF